MAGKALGRAALESRPPGSAGAAAALCGKRGQTVYTPPTMHAHAVRQADANL